MTAEPPISKAPLDHMGLIAAMSRDFAESRDIDTTLARGLDRIAATMRAQAASVFLFDESRTALVCRACVGPVDLTGASLPADRGIVGRTVRDRTTQLVRDADADPDFSDRVDQATGLTTRSVLCAPLSVRDECLGAIELVNAATETGQFSDADARLLEALAASATLAVINARMTAQVVERERLQREVELAGAIQRAFLPGDRTADFPVHGTTHPAREISGDCYDIVSREDGSVWFMVADVAGKGVNAALLMAKTASLFRYLAKTAADPAALLHDLNGEVCETGTRGLFVTMICGVLAPDRRTVRVANAGHEGGLLVTAGPDPTHIGTLAAQCPPLGIAPRLTRDLAADGVPLAGRRLYLFSDGVAEAMATSSDPHGAGRVLDLALTAEADALAPGACVDRIMTAARPDGTSPRDDMTLLRVEGAST
ncbi:sigma-B regulation protein RsbU (phosphoserine phosphatase) [Limimonas halophila]|uniref:Sigma-B regulation protein RsbU (Phosphoserine phosphatase) n=1 Tax=Limimonas halophila TaxID=1082479 RepID=A0A1G7MGQ9_9PROT|nr:GAF domain-containing SpoIIE family protein phosphatase [Limimonas halophila]SDF60895.1 sigma-B regulation protein RsbU (phosphoserine phosphatase) [Limimonas halophila]